MIDKGRGEIMRPEFLTGIPKLLLNLKIIIHVFLYSTKKLIFMEICPSKYVKLLYRALVMLQVFAKNKVVKNGENHKLQLYLPAYPSPAFFESFDKFIRPDPGPLTVVFSMTKACGYKCPHCYQQNDTGQDLDIELLKKVAREMQELGVTMFDIEGGEPLLKFDRLMNLLTAFDEKREIWVNTTGHTLTREKAQKMKDAGVYGVMISLHTADKDEYEKFTGFPGSFEIARTAAEIFVEEGMSVVINHCPSEGVLDTGGIDKIMEIANEWNCSFVQVIHPKSAGAWLGKEDKIAGTNKIGILEDIHIKYNSPNEFKDWTSASVQVFEESEEHFGCTAGGIDRFYINANGEVQPCEFLNVSFGNVSEDDFKLIYGRMRSYFRKPGVKWLCCTESDSIYKYMKENKIETTPLKWEHTKELMKTWDKGDETELYKKFDIYK